MTSPADVKQGGHVFGHVKQHEASLGPYGDLKRPKVRIETNKTRNTHIYIYMYTVYIFVPICLICMYVSIDTRGM